MTSTPTSAHPGFGLRSTAAEVLAGHQLAGRTAFITGGHSGLGLETTRALAAAGARVVVAARAPLAARAALSGLPGVEVVALDLADLDSVRRCAEAWLHRGEALDWVFCNAGLMACPETRVGPGWEAQFAVNHLGHHALVNRLWPALRTGARVVCTSSGAHQNAPIRWDDLHFAHGYDKWRAYGQSKTANALFAVQLDALGRHAGIRAFSLHPGKILTPLQRHLSRDEMQDAGWVDAEGRLVDPSFKTPGQGAATQVWAAVAPDLAGQGGAYCEDCEVAPITTEGERGVRPHALDPAFAARLWAVSCGLTGVDAFASVPA